jgi:DNA-binding MarR family transcriptional regulator
LGFARRTRELIAFRCRIVQDMASKYDRKSYDSLVKSLYETPAYRILLLGNLIGRPFFGQFGKRYSMTLNEWRIMTVLAANPGTSISGICEESGLHIMNVSRGVKGLVRQGRVIKKVDPDDRRRTILELSADGRKVFQSIAPRGLDWADTICQVLSEKEEEAFERLLNKLIDHVRVELGNGD